jgi:hypothetical protein
LPQVLTFMGMGQQQRHRLIIQCKEVAKENKMEMRFRQPNPESESGQLTLTLVARLSEDPGGLRGAGSRAKHKQSTAVPGATLSPYLQIIGFGRAVADTVYAVVSALCICVSPFVCGSVCVSVWRDVLAMHATSAILMNPTEHQ